MLVEISLENLQGWVSLLLGKEVSDAVKDWLREKYVLASFVHFNKPHVNLFFPFLLWVLIDILQDVWKCTKHVTVESDCNENEDHYIEVLVFGVGMEVAITNLRKSCDSIINRGNIDVITIVHDHVLLSILPDPTIIVDWLLTLAEQNPHTCEEMCHKHKVENKAIHFDQFLALDAI